MDISQIMEWIPLILCLLALAALAGFLAGLLGIGGGLVLVPGLYFIFRYLDYTADNIMHLAVGTSLATIIATGLSSARAHWKRGSVDFDLVKKIGVGMVIGVGVGTYIASETTGMGLKVVFASALVFFALLMQINTQKFTMFKELPKQPWPSFAGVVMGTICTLMGIGGAALNVPYMTLHNVPIHKAVGSSAAMGLLIAIPGVLGFLFIGQGHGQELPPYTVGYVNLLALAIIIPVTVLMAPVGVHVAHIFSVKALRRVFSIFLFIIAARMLFEVFFGK